LEGKEEKLLIPCGGAVEEFNRASMGEMTQEVGEITQGQKKRTAPRHPKSVPGRKRGVKTYEWIAEVLAHGPGKGSVIQRPFNF